MICTKNLIVILIMVLIGITAVEITKQSCSKKCYSVLSEKKKRYDEKIKNVKKSARYNEKTVVEKEFVSPRQPPPPVTQYVGLPINQLTQNFIDDWHYVGYVFPEAANVDKRYPLYARKNLYQKHLYDYHIVDNSRNRIKIYIDVPKGQYELYDNDVVKIDSEKGKWIVRIDVPADGNPYLYIP